MPDCISRKAAGNSRLSSATNDRREVTCASSGLGRQTRTIEEARAFAEKVYRLRSGNRDKFKKGNELIADIKGFEVEFANAEVFNLPKPFLHTGKEVDEFDCYFAVPNENNFLQVLKFDIKTSHDFLINKEQFARKKVDAYLFEEVEFGDWDAGVIFLKIFGWILKKDVVEKSELKKFDNGSEAYCVNSKRLKNPRELFGLTYAGGN